MSIQLAMSLIFPVLCTPLKSSLLSKKIEVSRYAALASQIPDDVLVIDEVFPKEDFDLINERFAPYLKAHTVLPFLGIVGGNVVAIGYGNKNIGRIYYYDFDFGIFPLDETLDEFLVGLRS